MVNKPLIRQAISGGTLFRGGRLTIAIIQCLLCSVVQILGIPKHPLNMVHVTWIGQDNLDEWPFFLIRGS